MVAIAGIYMLGAPSGGHREVAEKLTYEVMRTRRSKLAAKNFKRCDYQFAGPFQKTGSSLGLVTGQ